MLSSSLDTLLNVSKTTSPQKLIDYDCVTLYLVVWVVKLQFPLSKYTLTTGKPVPSSTNEIKLK